AALATPIISGAVFDKCSTAGQRHRSLHQHLHFERNCTHARPSRPRAPISRAAPINLCGSDKTPAIAGSVEIGREAFVPPSQGRMQMHRLARYDIDSFGKLRVTRFPNL